MSSTGGIKEVLIGSSQFCDVVWLWNAGAMFFLSFFTDYWEYREYDYEQLIPDTTTNNGRWFLNNETTVLVEGWDSFKWDHIFSIHVQQQQQQWSKNSSMSEESLQYLGIEKRDTIRYIYPEYANLYKECNDLREDWRNILNELNLLHQTSCFYFMLNSKQWNEFHTHSIVRSAEIIAFCFGCVSLILMTMALITGTYGSAKRVQTMIHASGYNLAIFSFTYALAIITFVVKMQLWQNQRSTLDHQTPLDDLIRECRRISMGWSLGAGALSVLLALFGSQIFIRNSRLIRKQRKSEIRRKRMEAAIVSPCRQEVALALRAKMIVLQ